MNKQEITESFQKQLYIENYSEQTIKNYISALKLFLTYIEKLCVSKVSDQEIKSYLYYCATEKQYSFSSMKQTIATIKYLYKKILKSPCPDALNIDLRKPNSLPVVLTKKEIVKILDATKNLKHKTMLFLVYAAGLRLGELLNLEISDIDSETMRIHIRQGKGKKDRYLMLSENVLMLLRKYYKVYKPGKYIIEGQKGDKYSPKSVQTIFKRSVSKAGIKKKSIRTFIKA